MQNLVIVALLLALHLPAPGQAARVSTRRASEQVPQAPEVTHATP